MAILGIDVGGTHTDGVVIDNNTIISKAKTRTDHNNLLHSITELIEILTKHIEHSKIEKITLSTTLTTNLILEKKLPHVGLIISGGPGINIENFKKDRFSYIVDGAIDHRGRVLKRINLAEIEFIIDDLLINDIETVAVCSKFSVRNPLHETLIKERLNSKFLNVTLGHSLSGNLNFPRRINTSYLNAAVYKKNRDFIENILKFLNSYNFNCPVYILKADGGTTTTEEALEKPIFTVLSGSSAGVIGIMSLMHISNEKAVVIDIGGTSSDFTFFYNGEPLFEPEGIKIGDSPTLVRSMFSHSLGLGGDSVIRVENNKILIGPERKGDSIAFGGKHITTTDIVIFYENIPNKNIIKIKDEIEKLSTKMNLGIEEFSILVLKTFAQRIDSFLKKLIEEINSKPIYTIKELIGYQEFKPEKIYLMGAPAKNFVRFLNKFLDYSVEVVPEYDVVNAIGAAVSKVTKELNLFADTSVNRLSIPEVDYFEKIPSDFTLTNCYEILNRYFNTDDFEITEESVFNIISGFYRAGKTFRIKAQVKPGVKIYLKEVN